MKLIELKNKKILILGFGEEGRDTFLALHKLFPKKVIGIADQKEFSIFNFQFSNTKRHLGKNYLKSLKNYDVIIKSPGIPRTILKPYLKKNIRVTSQTEIFFQNCPGTIIGVTGTKGKGTTSSLIYHILKKAGLKTHLVGNIGKPVFLKLLKAKKDDIFIYELSSHQLQDLKISPRIAVFLNIYPAHLDYYKNFNEYKRAKENIALHQTKNDFFIYNSDQKILCELAKKTKAKKIPIPANYEFLANIRIPLIGKFNLKNVMAAMVVAKLLGIKNKDIIKAIKTFKPLAHRLEFTGKYKGIKFYNDSLATIPQAVEAALEALGRKVKTLILGGEKVKGFDFSSLAKKILRQKIKTLIFLDRNPKNPIDTAKQISQIFEIRSRKIIPRMFFVSSMKEAVKLAFQTAKKEEICLLSPGSPSFNLFKNYKERGDLFKKYVKHFGAKL
ncbi:UDP-N-acetylmuramoyl-L-alanine--D-glutamate ligase [bacterium (Candidatus Gribaldobacteria) CG07_land_8_20_14_0_80_33_18]|uniref:UDP-N-acetylmuramoylalanine--D-glutamate ligase n=1 Tax=bacterium (Candidatus Gribaldobacteria) CG07_land_8_20_14_0_80_33_18 TaxID=2014272 RepID=A0A2M6Z2X5_9BACT|nr:MAG: UDP-N-acetylmuramoyl-L-alanine--D-glutamate ligase [bacterium (Candidatus Gribaldobacteria) CG10_big_fil_rev_8_21_14_0_10_33_41]PIU46768.1 MAG: UDP-N-acetylmuramoyl-L-alanine--D-glutamate ligase [bacterium (Candidatus Gribaldobacteria) CG07_land_8_20_14_0_80_33_18]PJA01167.1 MAG: UDP-N-acetylmuramoyl-L-alanine--D-glutamate ligase [bacterium (Candidatus Gribaldobacteria) CG_4_10_14_0_2_um_filter_33_15]